MFIGSSSNPRTRAITSAQEILSRQPVYLDTETTGLGQLDEIVEISVLDSDGAILVDTLVKPSRSIPGDASAIHGIYDDEVALAQCWPDVWPAVAGALLGRTVVIYNAEFDLRMMRQSHRLHGLRWDDAVQSYDLMALYASYCGDWDPRRRSFRFHSLSNAARACRLPMVQTHRALGDVQMSRALLHSIAEAV